MPMTVAIDHLFNHPHEIRVVATWIYEEFWRDKPGYSVEFFEGLLRDASDPDRIPLSLLAFVDGTPAGTVNLIHSDSETRPDLHPWLAALYVLPAFRHRSVARALYRAGANHARRLGIAEVYLGTDMPAFYERLGAELYERVSGTSFIMRVRLGAGSSAARV